MIKYARGPRQRTQRRILRENDIVCWAESGRKMTNLRAETGATANEFYTNREYLNYLTIVLLWFCIVTTAKRSCDNA